MERSSITLIRRRDRRSLAVVTALSLAAAGPGMAQLARAGFSERTVQVGSVTHRYRIYVPVGYTPRTRWPVILFLHGAGERGVDGLRQTEVGLGPAI
ncbi:MAG TPA: hypothetical protein VFN96_01635, partial [Gemmatimonadales bacterium]|nr:hypothetical protein [Gemmatimonadales bacterium]